MLKVPLQDQKQKVLKAFQSLGKFLGPKQATIRNNNYCIYYCFYYKRSAKLILLCIVALAMLLWIICIISIKSSN